MLSESDRCSLALDVLRGEQDSHKILADMLEESGDRGAAQWLCVRKGKRRKRLDFVLGILPYRLSLSLACSFVAHICRDPSLQTASLELEAIADSLRRDRTARGFRNCVARLADGDGPIASQNRIGPDLDSVRSLTEIAETAWRTISAEQTGDPKARVRLAEDIRQGVRRLAKSVQLAAGYRRQFAPYEMARYDAQSVRWQIEHTEGILEEIVQRVGV